MPVQAATRYAPYILSILRIVAALIFIEHGTGKMFGWPSGNPVPTMSLYWYAACIEIVGGILLLIGLFSRPAAFIMSGEMAFAYFMSHSPKALYPLINGGDAAILFCFVFLYIAFAGPGPLSVDAQRGSA
jgi:putative oxidoreductase